MQTLEKLVNKELTEKIAKILLMIIAIPFGAYVINLGLMTIYKLGQYSGTFLRNLYNIVCW